MADQSRGARRLVAIGDVGHGAAYHVGDEAMMLGLLQAATELGSGTDWTIVSADPGRSSSALGVAAVPLFGFAGCGSVVDRESMLSRIDDVLALPPSEWSAACPADWLATLTALYECEALVIAGGGNLSLAWPEHIYERVALVRAARRWGRRIVITGQSMGPCFGSRGRALVAEILQSADLVGVREEYSYWLATELGVSAERLTLALDDAIGLSEVEPQSVESIVGRDGFIAVTLNQSSAGTCGDGVSRLAAQLLELAAGTDSTILLVPHVGDIDGEPAHDVAFALQLQNACGDSGVVRVAPLGTPAEAIWYSTHASMVVSSRYHPVVFALAAATPALFISQDGYTTMKGVGALRLFGQQRWTLPGEDAVSGSLVTMATELWQARSVVRENLHAFTDRVSSSSQAHLAAVVRVALNGPEVAPATQWTDQALSGRDELEPVNAGDLLALADLELDAWVRRAGVAEAYAADLAKHLEAKAEELASEPEPIDPG